MDTTWPSALEWRHVQNEGAPELYMADFGPFTLYVEREPEGWRASLETCADGSAAAAFSADDTYYVSAEAACWIASRLLRHTLEMAWHAAVRASLTQRLPVEGAL